MLKLTFIAYIGTWYLYAMQTVDVENGLDLFETKQNRCNNNRQVKNGDNDIR